MKSQRSCREVLNERLDNRYKYEVSLIHIKVVANGHGIRLSVHPTITVDYLLALMRKLIGLNDSVLDWICFEDEVHLERKTTLAQCNIRDGSKLTYDYKL